MINKETNIDLEPPNINDKNDCKILYDDLEYIAGVVDMILSKMFSRQLKL